MLRRIYNSHFVFVFAMQPTALSSRTKYVIRIQLRGVLRAKKKSGLSNGNTPSDREKKRKVYDRDGMSHMNVPMLLQMSIQITP